MKEINKTIVAEAMNISDDQKPDVGTIKILKGISKSFNIEMPIIKDKYNTLIRSESVQNLNVESKVERERHVIRLLVADIQAIQYHEYSKGIDLYCDFGIELAIISDKITRTSVKMVNSFGKEYNFSCALKEINRVRSLLEDRMNKKFFDGE